MNRAILVLFLSALALTASAGTVATTPAPAPSQATLEDSLGYGYTRDTGSLAIDPLLVYAICEENETLVVSADHVDDVRSRLQATVAGDGSWVLPNGLSLHPQIGSTVIATPANQEDTISTSAPVVSVYNVILASFTTACTKTIKKHKCDERDCNGCSKIPGGSSGILESGGKVTFCTRTNTETDECKLTGGFKTCSVVEYENSDCTGQIVSTAMVNHKSCQR